MKRINPRQSRKSSNFVSCFFFLLESHSNFYTWWLVSQLRMLCKHCCVFQVKEVAPAARKRDARLSFAFVYPDRHGRNVIRTVSFHTSFAMMSRKLWYLLQRLSRSLLPSTLMSILILTLCRGNGLPFHEIMFVAPPDYWQTPGLTGRHDTLHTLFKKR